MSAKKALQVGKSTSGKKFTLPAEVATQATAILGIRGSGKTVTATVLVEELLELGWPVVVIDPTDVWWGLKSRGDKPGYPVVILGNPLTEHADLPLEAGTGAILADFAVERRVPMVLSLRHLRKEKQRTFVWQFAEQLYHRKGEIEHRTPLLVVIDEASAFVPQRFTGDAARMVGAIEDLVRRGRSAGIGVVLVDQRPASVNKDVLTQCEVMVAHRVSAPHDRKALDEWVRLHDSEGLRDTFLGALSSLDTGTAWFWAPTLDVFEQVDVRMRYTVDSSRTPKAGESPVAPGKIADVDLNALREQLVETVEEAKANDPKELKKRILELEQELRQAQKETAPSGPTEKEIEDRIAEAVRSEHERWHEYVDALDEEYAAFAGLVDDLQRLVEGAPTWNGRKRPDPPGMPATRTPAPPAEYSEYIPPEIDAPEELGGPQQKILGAMGSLEALDLPWPTRSNVAALSGYSYSGTFRNYLGDLRSRGLIEYPTSDSVALTSEGRALVGNVADPPSLAELHAAWMRVLPGDPHRQILGHLIDAYPNAMNRDELAERCGYAYSGTFRNYLGRLRSYGIVDYPDSSSIRATELLFPEGLR